MANPEKTPRYRFFEMIPGIILWSVLIGSIILSFIKPLWVIVFIIVYDLFWVFRVINFVIYLMYSWFRYKKDIAINWMEKVKSIEDWEKIYHVIYLPTYKEPVEVLDTTIESFLSDVYPSKKMIVIVGFEGRVDKSIYQPKIDFLQKKYGDAFYKLLITIHPPDLPGEMAAKGANAHWMGKRSQEFIDSQNIAYENVIVSYFDCDTAVHPKYFSALTHAYLTNPNPTRASYQPAVLYNNNIWDSPAAMRITAFSTVFWLMSEMTRPERLYTFSSHSMSFKALVDVGFWQKDIVTDDSRIFLQCFMHYDGDYRVQPMYVPVSMDTVLAEDYWSNYQNLYKQMRRWAWGVEHFPYMLTIFIEKGKKIPLYLKLKHMFHLTEGMFTWATAPILIFILGRLPLWVENNLMHESSQSSSFFVQNAPFILEKLMFAAMIGIFASAIFSLLLLPERPEHHKPHRWLGMIFQWLLLPITLILFGAIPAIEAQTRLMFGKYLGFFVTPKARKKT